MQDRIITIHLLHVPPPIAKAIEEAILCITRISTQAAGDFLFQSQNAELFPVERNDAADNASPQ